MKLPQPLKARICLLQHILCALGEGKLLSLTPQFIYMSYLYPIYIFIYVLTTVISKQIKNDASDFNNTLLIL